MIIRISLNSRRIRRTKINSLMSDISYKTIRDIKKKCDICVFRIDCFSSKIAFHKSENNTKNVPIVCTFFCVVRKERYVISSTT